MIRNLFYKHSPKNDILNLALLLSGTVIFLYFAPQILGALWLVFMLVLYFRSKNEALWLVYFLVLTDGFMSLFGLYSAVVPLLPGLPEIEVSQFYIIISFYKALRKQDEFSVFYKKILVVILIYLAFLILWGILSGLCLFSIVLAVYGHFHIQRKEMSYALSSKIPSQTQISLVFGLPGISGKFHLNS